MVELQPCGGLVNASAMCAIEQEMKGESTVNHVISEIAAELQREREKNAELMERISSLEAQIQERDKESLLINEQVSCLNNTERRLIKRFKRRKIERNSHRTEDGNTEMACTAEKQEDRLVNWMSMDDQTLFSHFDEFKDSDDIAADNRDEDTDDSDDEDEYYEEDDSNTGSKDREISEKNIMESAPAGEEPYLAVSGKTSWNKKPQKVPFCSKEIKDMLESDTLLLKNAQSHTVRKIIVFASLCISHGCEDMYELDLNHFSILRKGDPYLSPKNPGEHVLYENPGVQRKVFYPNRQNQTLCPVQILEEEKIMRPSDPNCPSCLFLCIKYGGRTRNLPQNEYVKQRMGRNKLKSFGPVMCQMAMLVHIRSGSFFFKALGITLLFMAGFPDDHVQRETRYRNLDLLQKYYRTDEDAEGEELFLSHSGASDTASLSSQQLTRKTTSVKAKGRRQTNSNSKSHNLTKPASSSSTHATQVGLMGYTSVQAHAMAAFQSSPSQQAQADATQFSNTMMKSHHGNSVSYHNQAPFHLFQPQPASTLMPMVYWPAPPSAFPPSPYPTAYGYGSYPTNVNYISIHPQP